MRKILFLCSRNRLRSPTAHEVFGSYPGIEVDSAGLSRDADLVVSADQIEWADTILVMEGDHRRKLSSAFGAILKGKRVAVLGIPDEYEFSRS